MSEEKAVYRVSTIDLDQLADAYNQVEQIGRAYREMRAEVASVLEQLDHLAQVWGDEGVFRSCRDRLRRICDE